ncbi:MAG: Ig-like domain-containing protein [Eubacteriales bacterium]|nr:Ig-like domain-containing protein [Eubacteriales bacterium]
MTEQKNKLRIKPVPAIIALVIALAAAGTGIYAAIHNTEKKQKENVQVNLNQISLKPENETSQVSNAVTTVEILLENTAIPVGTTIQVTALVTPQDTNNALKWGSSNQSVFTVSEAGEVTITGTGTAALTATIGTVSDAVAIEGIATVTSGSVNKYPVYTEGEKKTTGGAGNGDLQAGIGNGEKTSLGGSTDTDSNKWNTENTGINDNTGNTGTAEDTDIGENTDGGSQNPDTNGSLGTSQGAASTDIGASLPSYGFNQTMSNVYVCQENDTYYGEIITQPNVTICYIKQRSSEFDSKITGVLKELLPEEYNQVWSNYVSAATDRTFTAEGRRIRIVTAAGGGHSQIVIYN